MEVSSWRYCQHLAIINLAENRLYNIFSKPSDLNVLVLLVPSAKFDGLIEVQISTLEQY